MEQHRDHDLHQQMQRVQGLMVYLGSLSNGLEMLLGRGSESICFRSGRGVGLGQEVEAKAAGDLERSLELVQAEMQKLGINWPFSAYKKSTETELVVENGGIKEVKLAIKNCIVRCTLFRYGFDQGQSLCQTKHGLFCGLFDQVYGGRSTMDIVHAGENACLLKLKIHT
jgi:hypothetical protein